MLELVVGRRFSLTGWNRKLCGAMRIVVNVLQGGHQPGNPGKPGIMREFLLPGKNP